MVYIPSMACRFCFFRRAIRNSVSSVSAYGMIWMREEGKPEVCIGRVAASAKLNSAATPRVLKGLNWT